MEAKNEIRQFAENILSGFNFEYVGYSDANGQSMYFDVEGIKVRFSDHSVMNRDRVLNEVHFSISNVNSDYTKFMNEQKVLQLAYRLGDASVNYGKRQMLMRSGNYLEAFGYWK